MVGSTPSCVDDTLKLMGFSLGNSDTLWSIGVTADNVTPAHFTSIIKILFEDGG